MIKKVFLIAVMVCVGAVLFAAGATDSGQAAAPSPTIQYWGLSGEPQIVGDTADNPFCNAYREATGIDIEFTLLPATNTQEQFNLLVVSGNLPDIIEWDWLKYPGGPGKAIEDSIIIPLNDLIEKGSFPNMMAYMKAHPNVDKLIKMDDGTYYVAPMIRDGDALLVYWGPVIRQEFLDRTGLQVPETVAEWETMLRAFKDQLGLEAPLALRTKGSIGSGNAFVGAFETAKDFVIKNGKVVYGPIEPAFKDFLALWSHWYAEGLIDADVATADANIAHAKILNDEAGATITYTGSGIGPMLAARKDDPEFHLVAAKYPVLTAGTMPFFSQKTSPYTSSRSGAISTDSKYPEIAAEVLDFVFSERGRMVKNFGTEGVSYNMINGYPTYTERVTSDPTRNYGQMLEYYCHINGPGLNDVRYLEQYVGSAAQIAAINTWSISDVDKHMTPPLSFSSEEASKIASIMNDVKTLYEETYMKIFLGAESIDKWDEMVEQMRRMGIDEAVAIYNEAYNRYMTR